MQTEPRPDVNESAKTGNTPLHSAANSGSVSVTKVLLQTEDIQVNVTNPQCEDATPLHLAVMHGMSVQPLTLTVAVYDIVQCVIFIHTKGQHEY